MVRPKRMALVIDKKLSSKMTMSLASLHTSEPEPMANPTSAFFKAGASLTPSPVIPVTNPNSSDNLTNLLLSSGRLRATTLKFGNSFFTSSSDRFAKSLLVIAMSLSLVIRLVSLATLTAVSLLSPVIMTV